MLPGQVPRLVRIVTHIVQGHRIEPVTEVVVCTDHEVIGRPHRPLQRVEAVAPDQVVAQAAVARGESIRKGASVAVFRRFPARQVDQRGAEVHVVQQVVAGGAGLRDPGPLDDQRNPVNALIGADVIAVDAVLPHGLAVIRRDDDRRVVQVAQGVQHLLNVVVGVTDLRVVPGHHVIQVVRVPDGVRHVWRGAGPVMRKEMGGGKPPVYVLVTADRFVVRPGRRRRMLRHAIEPVAGGFVDPVRVPVVDIEKEVVSVPVRGGPAQYGLVDFVRRLGPRLQVGGMKLGPAQPEPGRAVPRGEVGEADGVVAVLPQPALHQLVPLVRAAVSLFEDLQLRSGAAVGDHAVVDPEPAGDPAVPGRHAGGIRAVVPVEPHPLGGDFVDGGRGRPAVSVATQVVGPQTVDVEVDDAQGGSTGILGRGGTAKLPRPCR